MFEKDAAVNTVLSRLGSSEHYPKIDDAKVFLNRQASMLMIRVPMVHQMIRVINQDLSITEQDVLEILLQRALKGRTYEALTKSEQEYMNKYGLKYPEEPEEKPELPSYSREDIPPELMDAGTQVFVPDYAKKESIIRERKICRWLDSIKKEAKEIYLVGDIFDFWFSLFAVPLSHYVTWG